jgi:hypothetical protein
MASIRIIIFIFGTKPLIVKLLIDRSGGRLGGILAPPEMYAGMYTQRREKRFEKMAASAEIPPFQHGNTTHSARDGTYISRRFPGLFSCCATNPGFEQYRHR